jgi:hypothetical protein
MAQEKQENLEAFESILTSAYSTMIWKYGDMEMRTQNLYQMDTFRVRGKKLHSNKAYASALEIVVNYEVPVLTALPVFEELIQDKWAKFGFKYHCLCALLPYSIFVAAFTASILFRFEYIREAQQFVTAEPQATTALTVTMDRRTQVAIAVDILAYALSLPYLCWAASFHNRLRWRFLDVNEDNAISWWEGTMFIFKNLQPIICVLLVMLLVAIVALRFLAQPNWLLVSQRSVTAGTWEHEMLAREQDLVAVTGVLVWSNVLLQLLPFEGLGLLLISMWRMLTNSVLKWFVIYTILVLAFSLGATVLMQLADTREQEEWTGLDSDRLRAQWFDMIKLFIWVSVGEVTPGALLHRAQNPALMTVLFIAFVVVSTLMLINLLISLMSNTFNQDVEKGKQTWWLEHAALVLRYERLLWQSQKNKYRCGIFVEKKLRADDDKTPRAMGLSPADHSDVEFYLIKIRSVGEVQRERFEWMKDLVPAMAKALEIQQFQVCLYVCVPVCGVCVSD